MRNFTDEQLVALAIDGRNEALDVLIERYLKLVYSFVSRYVRDDADAQDVAQEVFVSVWRHLEKFDQAKSFRPWLYTVAKNACLDFLRKRSHVPFSHFEADALEKLEMLDLNDRNEVSAPTLTDRGFLADQLGAAMSGLSPQYAEVVALHHDKDLNFREISEMKGESIHTVKSRYRRAIAVLRNTLDGFNF
ncbi:MAG: RNA polymerase sigma factor [Candidatus Peregrinibacteria bacterium]|nr:RNA polymerase sigma factor [Candidatus Peregrinibacteria bacterium]